MLWPACRPSTSIAHRRSEGTPRPVVGRVRRRRWSVVPGPRRAQAREALVAGAAPRGPRAARRGARGRRRRSGTPPTGPTAGAATPAMSAPITCGAGGPWRSSSRIGRTEPPLDVGAGDAVTREVEPVRVGLEPVAQRDARHREAVALGHVDQAVPARRTAPRRDRARARRRPRRSARRRTRDHWSAGSRRRPRPGASACADACAGCSARRAAPEGSSDRVDDGVEAWRSGAWPR